MGEAFLYGNNWNESSGKIVIVHVLYRSAVNVTCTNGEKTYTGITDANYNAIFKLPKGIWIITAEKDGYTSSINVNVSEDCTVNMSIFSATINVIYPAGSICTATDGVTTLTAPDTSGTWACVVPNAGTWTVRLDNGFSEVVSITEDGQTETINKWYLYKSGNEYTKTTGGWSIGVHTVGDGLGTVTKKDDTVYFHIPGIEHDDCPLATLNKVDLSKFKTLYAEYERVSCTNSSYFYLVASYLTIRGLSGSSGAVKHEFYNGGSNQIVAADISNVGVPNYVTVGIFASDRSEVNTAYLKSVWAM